MNIIKVIRDKYYRNAEMVSYWKTADAVEAKLYKTKDGHYEMQMKGEKYPFLGFPRGSMLFGKLSKLKHEIKNQIFNDTWKMLEEKRSDAEIDAHLEKSWGNIYTLFEDFKYDQVPFEKMIPPVKELHRAMTDSGCDSRLRDIICFIFQEDDAYRMRFQWIAKFFPWYRKVSAKDFEYGLSMLEEAEVVGDMKERERLVRRILLYLVKDSKRFTNFLKLTDWKKIGLTKADKYFFRAKYFKVDYPEYQY
jgi:hypothetical protein